MSDSRYNDLMEEPLSELKDILNKKRCKLAEIEGEKRLLISNIFSVEKAIEFAMVGEEDGS